MKEYSLEFLNDKADRMFNYLKEAMPSMNEEDRVIDRLMMLGKMLAESGEYKAIAQYKIDEVVHGEIGKAIFGIADKGLTTSTINMYVKAAAKDWNYLTNCFDRINSAAAKLMMSIQVMISYEKAKMNLV